MIPPKNLSEEEKQQQRELRDRLVAEVIATVDKFAIDNADMLAFSMTSASKTRLIVQAAIGKLIDAGFVTVDNVAEGGPWISVTLPDYLQPDIEAAILQYRTTRRE